MQLSLVEYKFVELVNIVKLIIFLSHCKYSSHLNVCLADIFIHDAACSLNKQNMNNLMNFLFIISLELNVSLLVRLLCIHLSSAVLCDPN